MAQTLTSSSRTITLPYYAELRELIEWIGAKNKTLSGKIYIDTFKKRGGWTLKFDAILKSEYDDIKNVYEDQIRNQEFLTFTDPDLNVTALSVYLDMPDAVELKWDKQVAYGLVITLEPENADSL